MDFYTTFFSTGAPAAPAPETEIFVDEEKGGGGGNGYCTIA